MLLRDGATGFAISALFLLVSNVQGRHAQQALANPGAATSEWIFLLLGASNLLWIIAIILFPLWIAYRQVRDASAVAPTDAPFLTFSGDWMRQSMLATLIALAFMSSIQIVSAATHMIRWQWHQPDDILPALRVVQLVGGLYLYLFGCATTVALGMLCHVIRVRRLVELPRARPSYAPVYTLLAIMVSPGLVMLPIGSYFPRIFPSILIVTGINFLLQVFVILPIGRMLYIHQFEAAESELNAAACTS